MNTTNSKRHPSPSELAVQSTYKPPTTSTNQAASKMPPLPAATKRFKMGEPPGLYRITASASANAASANPPISSVSGNQHRNAIPKLTGDNKTSSSAATNDHHLSTSTDTNIQLNHTSLHDSLHAPASTSNINAYDSMLGEIHDLLMAAQEAQSLGRLRVASTYQMLAHTRLIGLGKRFDRCSLTSSLLYNSNGNSGVNGGCDNSDDHHHQSAMSIQSPSKWYPKAEESMEARSLSLESSSSMVPSSSLSIPTVGASTITTSSTATTTPGISLPVYTTTMNMTNNTTAITTTNNENNHMTNAQVALSKVLPSHVHVDDTMMEHLARAAMELHNIRTARRGVGGSSWNPTVPMSPSKIASMTSSETEMKPMTNTESVNHADNIVDDEEKGLDMHDVEEEEDDDEEEDEEQQQDGNTSPDTDTNRTIRRGRGKSQHVQAMSTV